MPWSTKNSYSSQAGDRKVTKIGDVKRNLRIATIANDGLIVVKQSDSLARSREGIVVPRELCDGVLTALDLKLEHPAKHQLKLAFEQFFFALDLDKHLHRESDHETPPPPRHWACPTHWMSPTESVSAY